MDIHMSHMNDLILVDDRKGAILRAAFCQGVQFLDDRHELWNNGVQIMSRPFFQGFCKDRVVCVSAGVGNDLYSLLKINVMEHQETDQFRDHHAWVRIIDLDRSIVGKVMVIAASCGTFLKDKLRAGGNHEILLVDTEQTAVLIGVIRVEEKSQVFGDILFVKGDAVTDYGFIYRVQIKKIQCVGASFVSGNRKFIKSCRVFFSCQRHRENSVRSLCRTGIRQPEIRSLILYIVLEILMEKTAVIAKSHTVARKI